MKTSRIIAIAALVAVLILAMGLVTACGPTPTPTAAPTAVPTAVPPAPTKAPVEPTKAPPPPTAVPPTPTVPPKPTAVPVPPEAEIRIIAVPGFATDPHAITATVTYVTDTAVAAPGRSTVGLYTSGLSNVPISVPVYLMAKVADPKNSGTATFSLTKPAASKATITNTATLEGKFTPDVVGAYLVGVTVKNAAGLTSEASFVRVNAGTYIGVTNGKCATCHAAEATEWAKTPHATLFARELDNLIDGPAGVKPVGGYITHYSETCARCHTIGYYPAPYNGSGGYWDAKAAAKWTFPTWKLIDGVFLKTNASNWEAAPAGVKNMGTIGCEVCHGPANEHVAKGAKVMEATFDAGPCDQCHGAAANHSKGWQLANSPHADEDAAAWEISGPGEQGCVRCHTAAGFASFTKNPKESATWDNTRGPLGCAACHDPHSDETTWQLRVVGKPLEIPFTLTKDVGLSAICYTCHNIRRESVAQETAAKNNATVSYPHYSSASELLSDLGGFTYGATLPNSPHGTMVGAAPMPNPAAAPGVSNWLFTGADSKTGNIPGPCVVCHMTAAVTSPMTDTYAFKAGGHSFNTVTPEGNDYGASCKPCHGEVKDFNLKAKADYDGNGKVEGVQDEMKGLLNVLWKALEGKGVVKVTTGNPYATIPATADAKVKGAWFNFRFVYGVMWGTDTGNGNEGKAAAMHNFKRSIALLQLSLKDLTGSLPAAMTDATK